MRKIDVLQIPNGKVLENAEIGKILNKECILIIGNLVGEFSDFSLSKDGVYTAELPTFSQAKTEYFLSFLERITDPVKKTIIWTSDDERTYFSSLVFEALNIHQDEYDIVYTANKRKKSEYRYTNKANPEIQFNVYMDSKNRCVRIIGRNFIIGKYGDTSFNNDVEIMKSFKALDKSLKSLGGKMYFDGVIMNPPYDVNLHLKILAEVLKRTDRVVNISPVRWLQDPLAKYKTKSDLRRYEYAIARHIESLDIINAADAVNFFNAEMIMDLGVYVLSNGDFDLYKQLSSNTIIDKIMSKALTAGLPCLNDKADIDKSDGWRVRIQAIRPAPTNRAQSDSAKNRQFETLHPTLSWVYKDGLTKDGKHWSTNKIAGSGGPKSYTESDPLPMSIKFNTEMEAVNFENSTKTDFHRYMVLIMKTDQNFPVRYVPFMEDYTEPWTNERFYEFFDITPAEQKVIEDTIHQYV